MSILRLFDGTYESFNVTVNGGNVFRVDPSFDRIGEIILAAYNANGGAGQSLNLRILLDAYLSLGML